MAHTVRVTHRTFLPGVGNDRVSGVASNKKQMVVGVVDVTNYTSGGEVIRPEEFGLETVDYITFGPLFEQTTAYNVRYEWSTYQFNVTADNGGGQFTATNDVGEVGFLAVGDSAATPDLL